MARAAAHRIRPTGAGGRIGMRPPAEEQPVRLDSALPSALQTGAIRTVQRLAGNRAAVIALAAIQREEPAAAPAASGVETDGPGRVPNDTEEQQRWGYAFPDPGTARFRILLEQVYGYNCFAWAVGVTTRDITSDTIYGVGKYEPTLDGWTKYLTERHDFGRYVDGLDAAADVILYGTSADRVLHAARRAEAPFGDLTFTSKLGEQVKTPVILHAPADIQGDQYGHALRSFWRGTANQAVPGAVPAATPDQPAPK